MKKNIFKFAFILSLASILLLPGVSLAQPYSNAPPYTGNQNPFINTNNTQGTTGTTSVSSNGTSVGCIDAFRANETLGGLFEYATCLISTAIIPLIFAIATVVFIWGVLQYVINSEDEAKKDKGRQFMIWGLIGLTVMLCVWGIVAIIGNTFGVDTTFIPKVKQQ